MNKKFVYQVVNNKKVKINSVTCASCWDLYTKSFNINFRYINTLRTGDADLRF